MQDFTKLKVWEISFQFGLDTYKATGRFPAEEKYGITQQLRRAATSISANIAEGTGRGSNPDFLRFLYNAFGSVKECQNYLLLSKELGYLSQQEFDSLSRESSKIAGMLNKLIRSVKN